MTWRQNLAHRFPVTKENIVSTVFAVLVAAGGLLHHFHLSDLALKGVWILSALMIGLVLVAIMLVAGFAVFRAVVKASAGFTILIFLAETYCGLESVTPEGIQALTFLWGVSLLYILFEFAREFQKVCKEHLDTLGEDKRTWQGRLTITIFILFAAGYIAALYQVLNPIIHTLCIF